MCPNRYQGIILTLTVKGYDLQKGKDKEKSDGSKI